MSTQDNTLEVWLNDDLGPACLVGTLAHDRGQIRFYYERDWLQDPRALSLDNRPRLAVPLAAGPTRAARLKHSGIRFVKFPQQFPYLILTYLAFSDYVLVVVFMLLQSFIPTVILIDLLVIRLN